MKERKLLHLCRIAWGQPRDRGVSHISHSNLWPSIRLPTPQTAPTHPASLPSHTTVLQATSPSPYLCTWIALATMHHPLQPHISAGSLLPIRLLLLPVPLLIYSYYYWPIYPPPPHLFLAPPSRSGLMSSPPTLPCILLLPQIPLSIDQRPQFHTAVYWPSS
jgi:hypothetical protein